MTVGEPRNVDASALALSRALSLRISALLERVERRQGTAFIRERQKKS
jgi:hypothetical protein